MPETNQNRDAERPAGARFATTRWSLVLVAGGDGPRSRAALQSLCQAYWYPLYAYVRRKGYSVQDAQDLTQGFFARFLEKNYLGVISPKKGKFRSYLLGALKHFLANERDRARAMKRGGGETLLSLDSAEDRYRYEPTHGWSPERIFDRSWALTVLEKVLSRLKKEYAVAGKERLYDCLKGFLNGESDSASYRTVTGDLNLSRGAARVAVHRLRGRYRELLKNEISQTIAGTQSIDDEIRCLLSALSG